MPDPVRHSLSEDRYINCLVNVVQNAASTAFASPMFQDITFACTHCASPFVVDAAAAGMTLPCQRCGKPTLVPDISSKSVGAGAESQTQVAELRRQLKENESQRIEVTGYINQLSIQTHRWQLRLQILDERKRDLETQLGSSVGGR